MSEGLAPEITRCLERWSDGDAEALEELLPVVYDELRALGRGLMRQGGAGHTLQATALVHETYLQLLGQRRVRWRDRGHFMAVAATLMRRVLLRHAERKRAAKRGGDVLHLELRESCAAARAAPAELFALEEAVVRLAALDERQGRIVELRFYGGFTVEEISTALNISTATVKREWRLARAWLKRELATPGFPRPAPARREAAS